MDKTTASLVLATALIQFLRELLDWQRKRRK